MAPHRALPQGWSESVGQRYVQCRLFIKPMASMYFVVQCLLRRLVFEPTIIVHYDRDALST